MWLWTSPRRCTLCSRQGGVSRCSEGQEGHHARSILSLFLVRAGDSIHSNGGVQAFRTLHICTPPTLWVGSVHRQTAPLDLESSEDWTAVWSLFTASKPQFGECLAAAHHYMCTETDCTRAQQVFSTYTAARRIAIRPGPSTRAMTLVQ